MPDFVIRVDSRTSEMTRSYCPMVTCTHRLHPDRAEPHAAPGSMRWSGNGPGGVGGVAGRAASALDCDGLFVVLEPHRNRPGRVWVTVGDLHRAFDGLSLYGKDAVRQGWHSATEYVAGEPGDVADAMLAEADALEAEALLWDADARPEAAGCRREWAVTMRERAPWVRRVTAADLLAG